METLTDEQKKEKTQAKRIQLSLLSHEMRDLRDKLTNEAAEAGNELDALKWAGSTINDMLMQFVYNPDGKLTFNTFNQWREQGKFVMKGEKGIIIWGRPIEGKNKEVLPADAPADAEPREDNYSMFPLCFLFSDQQVH